MDLFIQENFFNQSWHIASVYDPHSGDEGVFVWRAGKAVRETFLVEHDTPDAPTSRTTHDDDIRDLRRRIKTLERRFDIILTGFLVLLLLALIAPLALVMFWPDAVQPLMARPLHSPPSTQPATMPAAEH